MLGAVIGDIIGSQFEFINYTSKNQMFKEFDFHFYTDKCKPTDDTTLTIAVLDCLMNKNLMLKPLRNMPGSILWRDMVQVLFNG